MPVERLMPTDESADLIDLVREITEKELRPRADASEAAAEKSDAFPRD
ncbi:MAG TPA: acyl-CoA dehydrogenase, partial [Tetrasphaera australiensis]|nr:acyl-CoA dehydrogenase [Tetrasphaera australiensis]